MTWEIEVKPVAEKAFLKLDSRTRQRIKEALVELKKSDNLTDHPQVKPLVGHLRGDYRLRVSNWRVLFTPERETRILHVYAILPRGSAY
jgi:mRNA-degrading endonuclease RelE of RelBE toxin-antitoxin system